MVIELFLPNHLRLGCPTEHVYHAFRGYTHGGSLDEIVLRSEIQNDYAAGVGFDGLVNERADFGEVFDLLEALVDLSGGEAEDGAVQVDVVASGEFGVEAGAEFEQRGDASGDLGFSRGGLEDSGDDLQEGAFAGTVFADDAEGFAAFDGEGDVAEGLEVGVEFEAGGGDELFEAVPGRVVDGVGLGDVLEVDLRHGGPQSFSLAGLGGESRGGCALVMSTQG